MNKLRDLLTQLLNVLAGASFLVMVILTCWQVLTRYVLNNPSSWSEELVSYMFAWMSLLGASLVTAERGHMNIPIVVEKCSPSLQKLLLCLAELIGFLFSAIILAYGGFQIANLAMGQMTSSLGVPIGVFYVVLPLCGVLNMVYTVLNMTDIIKKKEGTA
ncbi:TRAP transporter small permease [bacterium D16-54]|nr:TRAP transporter small permease [bacterium D16-54]RKJ13642.1 TRAP transporter small permease [bacterium D16-56]